MTRRSTLYAILAPLTAFLTVFWYGYRYVHPLLLPFTGAALGAALITALLGWRKEALRLPLLQAWGATLTVWFAFQAGSPIGRWLLDQVTAEPWRYWLIGGPGTGMVGQLPAAVLVLLVGRWLFGLDLTQQWGGQLGFTRASWGYGLLAAVALSAVTIGLAAAVGAGHIGWEFSLASFTVNMASNLWEEIINRTLLLQVLRRGLGDRTALIWTAVVFGLQHGFGPKGVFIAVTSWIIAWAVLRARSLWAGWTAHQASDLLVDSLLH